MARVKQFDVITGSIANLSFYTRKGSDKVFVRTKGGPSKNKIKRNPEFANVRRNNREFGGCSTMSHNIRYSFYGLHHVADYNLSSTLCSLCKTIQKLDTDGVWGERSIRLSKYRSLLSGFEFNRINRFSSIFRIMPVWNIDRYTQQCIMNIPAFDCSYGLQLPGQYSSFRLVVVLGVVSDLQINASKSRYEPTHGDKIRNFSRAETPWFSTKASIQEQQLIVKIKDLPELFKDDDTLVLSIAIEFGTLDALGNQIPLKNAGAGMILETK